VQQGLYFGVHGHGAWATVSVVALDYFVLTVDLPVSAWLYINKCSHLFSWYIVSITDI
jgi:hypothetical protein